jgi:hypothetical protein
MMNFTRVAGVVSLLSFSPASQSTNGPAYNDTSRNNIYWIGCSVVTFVFRNHSGVRAKLILVPRYSVEWQSAEWRLAQVSTKPGNAN